MLTHAKPQAQYPQRIVILGGTGFIGCELQKQLKHVKVEVLSLSSKQVDLTTVESVALLKNFIRKEDALVFTSALTPDKGKDVKTLLKNLSMSQNLATFVEQHPFTYFAHISSDAVYGNGEPLMREETPCSPTDLYGYMHLGRELILRTALQKAKIPHSILRPCSIYGPGDTHNSYGPNRFVRTAQKEGRITLFGQGEEKRDHVHVKDVAQIIALCLSYRSEGVLNIVTGTSVTFHQIATWIAQKINTNPSQKRIDVLCLPRAIPITHRHFDATGLAKSFPAYHCMTLEQGLTDLMNPSPPASCE